MPQAFVLCRFTPSSSNDSPGLNPNVWQIQGSTDDLTWTNIFRHNVDDPAAPASGAFNPSWQSLECSKLSPSLRWRTSRLCHASCLRLVPHQCRLCHRVGWRGRHCPQRARTFLNCRSRTFGHPSLRPGRTGSRFAPKTLNLQDERFQTPTLDPPIGRIFHFHPADSTAPRKADLPYQ